jgi:hypothetical protein
MDKQENLGVNMDGYYDIAQICLNGHVINHSAETRPQHNRDFCPTCGEKTITKCPSCNNSIQGNYHAKGVSGFAGIYNLPAYCQKCGKSFPWTENKIQTAIQIFVEFGNLDEAQLNQTKEDIKNIARDVPQAELSAMRIKALWGKYGNIAYNVIMEFASKTASEILKHP